MSTEGGEAPQPADHSSRRRRACVRLDSAPKGKGLPPDESRRSEVASSSWSPCAPPGSVLQLVGTTTTRSSSDTFLYCGFWAGRDRARQQTGSSLWDSQQADCFAKSALLSGVAIPVNRRLAQRIRASRGWGCRASFFGRARRCVLSPHGSHRRLRRARSSLSTPPPRSADFRASKVTRICIERL